ncbi:seryl-tRNA synthetase, also charges selenocysteinyl-tRNA with serine [uncultured Sporomusa sp.]|uniref:Serine--tRNA ligase n=1 Tax=uncultured Sporomusa sp. TaxID=307249 RepID=A0A212LZ71_9FIRM|nr:serine--tRNA ligase [uncultured Sporomusa sp.]SCM82699.1 seryl-tRNA synthetase, also charges selenocysteinyl-tRNA with serine [uncultured Sporomusa sp.]
MLDIKFLRDNPEKVEQALQNRGAAMSLDEFLGREKERRELLAEVEVLKNKRNTVSQEISKKKKAGENADDMIVEMREVGDRIGVIDTRVKETEAALAAILMNIPNVPHQSVPVGKDEQDNPEIRRWGTPREFAFEPKPHWEIGEKLGILDFERGGKVTGARFTFYKGLGSRLERSLINFMLDLHTKEHGYTEFFPPFIVNEASMIGTGQLPKFAQDMFKLEGLDYYLIPTAEVPITNLHRQEILDAKELPLNYTAYSACFRAEAGAAGRDTRGLIRQHQFNKVEMVKFCLPEESYSELEKLTLNAEKVLQLLGLPHRTILLCTGDMGFCSAKTYDLEVWLPSFNTYREISSCSNFEDFQARRAEIKFRREPKAKPEFVHTLNGSGVAIGRTVAAILENYQQEDGSVMIPELLRPYMGVDVIK